MAKQKTKATGVKTITLPCPPGDKEKMIILTNNSEDGIVRWYNPAKDEWQPIKSGE